MNCNQHGNALLDDHLVCKFLPTITTVVEIFSVLTFFKSLFKRIKHHGTPWVLIDICIDGAQVMSCIINWAVQLIENTATKSSSSHCVTHSTP